MKSVLLTGGSGFIGGYLVEALLAHGVEVRCLVRDTSKTDRIRRDGVTFVKGDLVEPASLAKAVADVDTVFHLAALTAALKRDDMMRVNAHGTRNLISACSLLSNPPVFVLVSSLAAAGPSIDGRPRVETDDCRPVSEYGRSKRGGEIGVANFADLLPVTIIRPPFVFGGGDDDGLQAFRAINRYGIHPVPGMRHRRSISLVHAADLAAGTILAAERGSRVDAEDRHTDNFRQGCYFVCFDQHPRYSQFGTLIGNALGRRRVFKLPSPDSVTKVIGAVNGSIARFRGKPSVLNLDKTREATAGSWTCSPQKIQQELGFAPAATLEQRLKETADWYQDHGWL